MIDIVAGQETSATTSVSVGPANREQLIEQAGGFDMAYRQNR
jgi:hypothetical protein